MNCRIRRYLDQAPEAISGSRGHLTTLRVARSLHNGFALDRHEVLEGLRVYNSRLSDKWTERELEHKADSAASGPYDKPRGWMLSATDATVPGYSQSSSDPRETVVLVPRHQQTGVKKGKKYVLATDATAPSYSQRSLTRARTHARACQESEISVASVPNANPGKPSQPAMGVVEPVASVPKASRWTEEQIRREHRPLWRFSNDGRWEPLNDAARKLVQAARPSK